MGNLIRDVEAEIRQILEDYKTTLFQQMGYILDNRHRLDVKTADKMLIETPIAALTLLLERREAEARYDELSKLQDYAEENELSLEARQLYAPDEPNINLSLIIGKRAEQLTASLNQGGE